jgi:hypothetical protein
LLRKALVRVADLRVSARVWRSKFAEQILGAHSFANFCYFRAK